MVRAYSPSRSRQVALVLVLRHSTEVIELVSVGDPVTGLSLPLPRLTCCATLEEWLTRSLSVPMRMLLVLWRC